MKRFLCLILSVLTLLSLVACTGNNQPGTETTDPGVQTEPPTDEMTTEETTEETTEAETEPPIEIGL